MNHFAAEPAIVERLKQFVPQVRDVQTPFSISDMVESSQASPSMYVIYSGDTIDPSEAGKGAGRMVKQLWTVVLAVRTSKSQLQKTDDARQIAGDIIPQIIDALQGWKPTEAMGELSRVAGVTHGYSSSFAYFPLTFSGRITTVS